MSQPYPTEQPPSYAEATTYGTGGAANYGYSDKPVPPPVGYYPPSQPASQPIPMTHDDDSDSNNITMGSFASFSDKAVRRAFIRKVYLILLCQLLITAAFIGIFLKVDPVRLWVQHNSWFYYLSYGVFLVTMITLVCCPGFRRKYPANFICLLIFTLAFSYMTGTISSFYRAELVLIAAGITAAVCLAISIFAIQTKIDFTMCSGLLFVLCIVVLLFGLSVGIVYAVTPITHFQARVLQCTYGGLAALLFGLFLVFDTQQIMGGRKHELSPEEYIYGALQLYLDVVYLFLIILSLFGSSD